MVLEDQMSRAMLLALLALSTLSCVGSSPTAAGRNSTSRNDPTASSVPNYAGNWSGTYAVDTCKQSGEVAQSNICAALGNTPPFTLSITQDNTRLTVSLALGSIQFPSISAKVLQDGSVSLAGDATSNGFKITVNMAFTLSGATLTGTVKEWWTSATLSGKVVVAAAISTAVRN